MCIVCCPVVHSYNVHFRPMLAQCTYRPITALASRLTHYVAKDTSKLRPEGYLQVRTKHMPLHARILVRLHSLYDRILCVLSLCVRALYACISCVCAILVCLCSLCAWIPCMLAFLECVHSFCPYMLAFLAYVHYEFARVHIFLHP